MAFARAASERFRALGPGARRGLPETLAFGTLISDLRLRNHLDCLQLAERAGLNPVYLLMLERGLLGPDEIPAMVVARLAVALGRRLSGLPLLPYAVDAEPEDTVDVTEGTTWLQPGLSTLVSWVSALLDASSPTAPPAIRLPDLELRMGGRRWWARRAHLTDAPVPIPSSDEYSWRLLRGRGGRSRDRWWLFAWAGEADTEQPATIEVELTMGTQRRVSVAGARGLLSFDGLDLADLGPLRFRVLRAPG